MITRPVSKEEIIAALEQLPLERWAEVSEFIEFLRFRDNLPRPKRATLPLALGLLATGQPPPSEAEIERWLEERRIEKYA
ncbi:MAG TPA: hypothetical protein VJL59_03970 [Anaerolineales bacterium]|nr:hypothetical protein [Anaerolineales bacterium]